MRVRGRRIALILLADSSSEHIAALFISRRILFGKKTVLCLFLLHVLLKATLFANYEIVFVSETVTLC